MITKSKICVLLTHNVDFYIQKIKIDNDCVENKLKNFNLIPIGFK